MVRSQPAEDRSVEWSCADTDAAGVPILDHHVSSADKRDLVLGRAVGCVRVRAPHNQDRLVLKLLMVSMSTRDLEGHHPAGHIPRFLERVVDIIHPVMPKE